MKTKLISYARLINKGNYEHVRIELQAEIEEGEKAEEVYLKVKEFVEKRCRIESLPAWKIEQAREVSLNKSKYKLKEIEEAEKLLQDINDINDVLVL